MRKSMVASIAFQSALPRMFLEAVVWRARFRPLGVVENEDAIVTERDFLGFPSLALVEAVRVGIRRIPGTVEMTASLCIPGSK